MNMLKKLILFFSPVSEIIIISSIGFSYILFIHNITLYEWDIIFKSWLFIFITIVGFAVYLGTLFLTLNFLIDQNKEGKRSEHRNI